MGKHSDKTASAEQEDRQMVEKPKYQPPIVMPLGDLMKGQGKCELGSGDAAGAGCKDGTGASSGTKCQNGFAALGRCNSGTDVIL